jgi:hypothetical protein
MAVEPINERNAEGSGRWRRRDKPQLCSLCNHILLMGRAIGILKDRTVNPAAQIPLSSLRATWQSVRTFTDISG